MSERLQVVLGQPIIVDYKSGAGGTVDAQDAFKPVLNTPEVRNRMLAQGADPAFLGSDDFAKFLAAEMPRWADAAKQSCARMD